MTTLREAAPVIFGAAALTVSVFSVAPVASADPAPVPSAPCYNGITPFNPYVDNCAIPSRPARILGSAPDQTALLNCSVGSRLLRALCLSQFVNGGPYPGIALGIG
jgi:hypothetical protein